MGKSFAVFLFIKRFFWFPFVVIGPLNWFFMLIIIFKVNSFDEDSQITQYLVAYDPWIMLILEVFAPPTL